MPVIAPATVAAALASIKETQYFPANNGWNYLWLNYSALATGGTIAADLAAIATQGFNCIRVDLPVDGSGTNGGFSYPTPTAAQLANLVDLISRAKTAGLKVSLTLLDFWASWTEIGNSRTWIKAIRDALGSLISQVVYIDIQNELEPHDTNQTNWAKLILPCVRGVFANSVPVTVSVTNTTYLGTTYAALTNLQALQTAIATVPPDFWSIHIYGDVGMFYWQAQQAQVAAGSTPLYVGETGYASCALGINAKSISAAGSGYATGTTPLALTGGTGSGATGHITTVSSGGITGFAIDFPGWGYTAGDVLAVPGGTSGTVTVSSVISSGSPSGLALTKGWVEDYQDRWHRTAAWACQVLGIPSPMVWDGYEFAGPNQPSFIIGAGNQSQQLYGVMHTDRTLKPAASSLASIYAATAGWTQASSASILDFNGACELIDAAGNPLAWRKSGAANGTFATDTGTVHGGSRSLKLNNTNASTASWILSPIKHVVPGQSYTLTVWVNTGSTASGTNKIALSWFSMGTDGSSNFISNASASAVNGTVGWQQLTVTATAPAGTAMVQIFLSSTSNPLAVWFDDIVFA